METVRLYAQCHCRKNTFHCDVPKSSLPLENGPCHCDDCRHVTGLLFADYVYLPPNMSKEKHPFDIDNVPSGLSTYRKKNGTLIWYFCSTCGAHIVQAKAAEKPEDVEWYFAQGITYPLYLQDGTKITKQYKYIFVKMGRDKGGACQFLPDGLTRYAGYDEPVAREDEEPTPEEEKAIEEIKNAKTLPLSCLCGHVKLIANRPSNRPIAEEWKSAIKKEGWSWNFCLCSSCRTTSGYDASCFFYLPYSHIDGPAGSKHATDGLQLYQSYHNTRRWFCPTCGASVFYDNLDRGDLTDVFLGLIDAPLAGVFDEWIYSQANISYWYDARDKEFANILAKGICPGRVMDKEPKDTSKLANYNGTLQL